VKSSSVRGTPYTHVTNTAQEGISPRTPKGMSGTVNKQFEGDQKGNRQEGVAKGTPYQSQAGNSDEFVRVRSRDKYGKVIDDAAGDQANYKSNGNGVILDGIAREMGYTPMAAATMDSPVMMGAPHFDTRTIRDENLAHIGQGIGAAPSQSGDDILAIGGVISRGMENVSRSNGGEDELLEDDVLRNLGRGGTVG
jgi:hypothetical protein